MWGKTPKQGYRNTPLPKSSVLFSDTISPQKSFNHYITQTEDFYSENIHLVPA